MKQYRFARLYLYGLLIAAVLCLLWAAAAIFLALTKAVQLTGEINNVKSAAVVVDTETLSDRIAEAHLALLRDGIIAPREIPIPIKSGFSVGPQAALRGKELEAFSRYLIEVAETRDRLKQAFVRNLDRSLSTLTASAAEALRTADRAPSHEPPRPDVTLHTRDPVGSASGWVFLYEQYAHAKADVDSIKRISEMLVEIVALYTDSPEAARLAKEAARSLAVIWQVLHGDASKYQEARDKLAPLQETIVSREGERTKTAPTVEVGFISEFLNRLETIHASVKIIALSGWRVDKTIKDLQEELDNSEVRRLRDVSKLKGARSLALLDGGRVALISFVGGLLLLICRDFLSAVVDIATNTAGILQASKDTASDPK